MGLCFKPLFETLKEKDVQLSQLREVLDATTVAKFRKNHDMRLSSIEKVCKFLDVPIEKVVKIETD